MENKNTFSYIFPWKQNYLIILNLMKSLSINLKFNFEACFKLIFTNLFCKNLKFNFKVFFINLKNIFHIEKPLFALTDWKALSLEQSVHVDETRFEHVVWIVCFQSAGEASSLRKRVLWRRLQATKSTLTSTNLRELPRKSTIFT